MTNVARSLPDQLREQRLETILSEVERVALALFDERGFGHVTVEEIATEAGISVRTFYRYFPAKEDVLKVRLRREAELLRATLSERAADDSPLHSIRTALEQLVAAEDPDYVRRWIRVITLNQSVLPGVIGGIHLILQPVLREFFASRLDLPEDSLPAWIWASAAFGAIEAAHIHWYLGGGDLAQIMSEGLKVLEDGIGGGGPLPTANGSTRKGKR